MNFISFSMSDNCLDRVFCRECDELELSNAKSGACFYVDIISDLDGRIFSSH